MNSPEHLALSNTASLFQMLAGGDQTALIEIYNRYYDRVYRLAFTYCKNKELARDTAQMIFLSIWERRAEMYKIENAEGWLFRAAKYQVWRLMEDYLNNEHEIVLSTDETGRTPEEQLVTKQEMKKIHAAIASLPPKQQQVFNLCRLEGWSYRQVAEQLGIGKETVKDHMSKALRKLRDLLKDSGEFILIFTWYWIFF